jgi:hypothetical protein
MFEVDNNLYMYTRNGILHFTPSLAFADKRKDEGTDIGVA